MRIIFVYLALALFVNASVSAQEYRPAYEGHRGRLGLGSEIVLVYFGGTSCGPCHRDDFKKNLERAKIILSERATSQGKAFSAVGVALDWNVREGFDFLMESGEFDEISVGRNWENSAAIAHLWRPEGIEERSVALPGLVVFEREIRDVHNVTVASEPSYMFEAAGADTIASWIEAGAPLE